LISGMPLPAASGARKHTRPPATLAKQMDDAVKKAYCIRIPAVSLLTRFAILSLSPILASYNVSKPLSTVTAMRPVIVPIKASTIHVSQFLNNGGLAMRLCMDVLSANDSDSVFGALCKARAHSS